MSRMKYCEDVSDYQGIMLYNDIINEHEKIKDIKNENKKINPLLDL
jgi:hypothetical protein